MIELNIKNTVKIKAKELRIYCKVSDCFSASLHDEHGTEICSQDQDYVPGFMPGEHYGDYVILNIDIESGRITNWEKPSALDLQEWADKCIGATSE